MSLKVGDLVRLSDGQTIALITGINKKHNYRVMTSRGFFFALVAPQIKEVINESI